MIALDTNVLVRFLVQDDQIQSAKAAKLIRRAVTKDEPLYLSDVTMCETGWVLSVSYKFKRTQIVDVMKQLLKARHLAFDDVDLLARSVTAFERGKGDFADYVIREHARRAGCSDVATFDRALLKENGFVAP